MPEVPDHKGKDPCTKGLTVQRSLDQKGISSNGAPSPFNIENPGCPRGPGIFCQNHFTEIRTFLNRNLIRCQTCFTFGYTSSYILSIMVSPVPGMLPVTRDMSAPSCLKSLTISS